MIRSRKLASYCLLSAAFCLFFAGCVQKASTVGQEARREEPQLAADLTSRVREIQSKVTDFQTDAAALPGGGANTREADAMHRRLMLQCFTDLTQVLPLIEGQYQSGEFRQGMRILESSRQQLAGGSIDLAAEPTIGQGIRASLRLLQNLNTMVFSNDADITKRLDALRQKVNELDTARGSHTRVVAAQSMRGAADVLQQMAGVMADRAGIEGKPTTAPTTKPDVPGTATVR